MAKFEEKIKAQKLRKQGKSIKEIAKKLKVSKGSASIWCRDIELTKEQIAKLERKMIEGGHRGRLKGAKILKERHIERVREFKKQGSKQIGKITKRDFLRRMDWVFWLRTWPIYRAATGDNNRRPPNAADSIMLLRSPYLLRPYQRNLLVNCPAVTERC